MGAFLIIGAAGIMPAALEYLRAQLRLKKGKS